MFDLPDILPILVMVVWANAVLAWAAIAIFRVWSRQRSRELAYRERLAAWSRGVPSARDRGASPSPASAGEET